MNTTEFLFALLMLAAFTVFTAAMEAKMGEAAEKAAAEFRLKFNAVKCAATINEFYASAGGNLEEKMECAIEDNGAMAGKHAAQLVPEEAETINDSGGTRIWVKMDGHYG